MASKKKKNSEPAATAAPIPKKNVSLPAAKPFGESFFNFLNSNTGIWAMTAISFAAYYIFSFFHTSFYQGEEGAQYMSMKSIWHDPNMVLGNWPKTGWKILYAVPVLFGKTGVLLANCLFAAFSGFFAAQTVKAAGGKWPWLAQLLLLTQPLWFYLAFKSYSEIPTSFLIVMSAYFAIKQRFILSALFISYVFLIRQEFVYLFIIYGVYLIVKKRYIAFLCLGVFPIFYAVWGWMNSGDMMWLMHSTQEVTKEYKKLYPRQGFLHYFTMSEVIFGAVCMVGLLIYISQSLIQRAIKPLWFVLVPAVYFLLIHAIFNDKVMNVGPSTGGNLRYMLSISPLLAVLTTLAAEQMQLGKGKALALVLLIPFMLLAMENMTFEHNWVKFHPEEGKNYVFPLLTILTIAVLFIVKTRYLQLAVMAVALVQFLSLTRPKELADDQNWLQRQVVGWSKEQKLEEKGKIFSNLSLVNYYYDKNPWEFKNGFDGMSEQSLDSAKVGSVIFWDTNFATKYGKVNLEYFQKNATKYKVLKEQVSPLRDMQIIVFEKVAL